MTANSWTWLEYVMTAKSWTWLEYVMTAKSWTWLEYVMTAKSWTWLEYVMTAKSWTWLEYVMFMKSWTWLLPTYSPLYTRNWSATKSGKGTYKKCFVLTMARSVMHIIMNVIRNRANNGSLGYGSLDQMGHQNWLLFSATYTKMTGLLGRVMGHKVTWSVFDWVIGVIWVMDLNLWPIYQPWLS